MRFLALAICLFLLPVAARAEGEISIGIPIRVVIIQCGTQAQAHESCESGTEPRCCAVVDPALIELEEKKISTLDIEKQSLPPGLQASGVRF